MSSADNAVHLTMRIMGLQLLARQCVAASLRLMVQLLGLPQKVVGAVRDLCATMEGAEPPVVLPTMGGSLPLNDLAQALDMPLISLPLANHDDNQHAPNENLRLGHFVQGIRTMLMALHGLGG